MDPSTHVVRDTAVPRSEATAKVEHEGKPTCPIGERPIGERPPFGTGGQPS